MTEQNSNKTIFKNTVLLYFRMALVTVVGLYTSRVILQMLGVDDYGIYTVAGSAVALFTFINSALGQSSSRYLTVVLGKVKGDDVSTLTRCFKTTRAIHGILAMLIVLVCETFGLWMLYSSSIPAERMNAAFWVFQISVITAVINITQVPFNALIIAHERMGVFAYISIFEVIAKLLVCYLLVKSPIDKLIYYAILIFLVQLIVFLCYRLYSVRHFQECRRGYIIDREFFKPIMSFSFWNLFGSLSYSALTQGTTIIISFFFGPALVTSRAIANQVKSHVTNFVTSFRTAINPQILKRNSAGEIASSHSLLFQSANITFYLMLIMVLPLMFEAPFILDLWLDEVPEYTVEFTRIVLLEMLVYTYDITYYQIFQAEGRLKENAIICPIMDFVGLAIVYVIYMMGGSVLTIAWCMVILTVLQGCVVKPFLAVRLFGYVWKDFLMVFNNNIKVLVLSVILPAILYFTMDKSILSNCMVMLAAVFSGTLTSYFVGLRRDERERIHSLVINKFRK